MIPRSGNRFSEKIMLDQNDNDESDSMPLDRILAAGRFHTSPALQHGFITATSL